MHQNHTVFIAHHRLMMYAVAVSFNLKKKKGLKEGENWNSKPANAFYIQQSGQDRDAIPVPGIHAAAFG